MSDIKDKKKNIKVNDADYFESNSKREKNDIKSSKSTNGIVYIILTFCVCLCLFGGFYEFYLKHLVIETTKTIKDVTITDTGIADAVEKVYDSVVTVKNYVRNQLYSTGSGFVFKVDNKYGYILTNYHVISGGNEVSVVFTNNKDEKVTIVGYDEYSDIAVLAVDKSLVLATAQIGSSNDMRIGDTTFAVGTPVDSSVYSWSVTRGILSGKDRMVAVSVGNSSTNDWIMNVMQTDAAINPGNSGGPLCNVSGEVIGVNSMKIVKSEIEGIGFAIPIEDAIEYANLILKGEKIQRAYLGVSMTDFTTSSQYLRQEGITIDNTVTCGVIVVEAVKGGPCADVGIKKGDVIIKIGKYDITSVAELRYYLYKYKPKEKIEIRVMRGKTEKIFNVTLGAN